MIDWREADQSGSGVEPIGIVEEDDARQVSRLHSSVHNAIQVLGSLPTVRSGSVAPPREIYSSIGAGLSLEISLRDRSMLSGTHRSIYSLFGRRISYNR